MTAAVVASQGNATSACGAPAQSTARIATVFQLPAHGGVRPSLIGPQVAADAGGMGPIAGQSQATLAVPQVSAQSTLDPRDCPWLTDHVVAGRPVLPMAMMLEYLAMAALHGRNGARLRRLSGLRVLRPCAFDSGARDVRVLLQSTSDAAPGNSLAAQLQSRAPGGEWTTHVRSDLELGDSLPPMPHRDPQMPPSLLPLPFSIDEVYRTALFHGPAWRCLTEIRGIGAEGLLALARPSAEAEACLSSPGPAFTATHPLLVDAALQAGLVWCRYQRELPALPTCVGAYIPYVTDWPTSPVIVRLEVTRCAQPLLRGNVQLMTGAGKIMVELREVEWTLDAQLNAVFRPRPADASGAAT